MISLSQYAERWRQGGLSVTQGLNIKVWEHGVVTVVGSNGPGKSLLTHTAMGLLPQNIICQGTISFREGTLTQKKKEQLRGNRMVLIPQSVSYPDPLMKTRGQVQREQRDRESVKRYHQSMGRYELGGDTEELYPFGLSGGMTRRVPISAAAAERPRLVITDESTPDLHIDAARRILSHLQEIADQGAGVLLITHDLELALEAANRIVIFYAGIDVGETLAGDFEDEQKLHHPYAKALFRAMPHRGFKAASETQLYAADMPAGCPYRPRCLDMDESCLREVSYRSFYGGMVRCRKAGM